MAKIYPQKINPFLAISVGTLTGWFGILVIDIFTFPLLSDGPYLKELAQGLMIIPYYIIIGIPVASVLCFILGLPLWALFKRGRGLTQKRAIIMGMIIGGVLGSVNAAIFFNEYAGTGMVLDWLSTVLVGGFAGRTGFNVATRQQRTEDTECFS